MLYSEMFFLTRNFQFFPNEQKPNRPFPKIKIPSLTICEPSNAQEEKVSGLASGRTIDDIAVTIDDPKWSFSKDAKRTMKK